MQHIHNSILCIICCLFIIAGCQPEKQPSNSFLAEQDTLIITLEKQKGYGLFLGMLGYLSFMDLNDSFPHTIEVPEYITEVERAYLKTDFRANKPEYVDIIQGVLNGERVFVVDQNNNRDLTDDSVRLSKKVDWGSESDLIPVNYRLDEDSPLDSSWVKMGMSNGELLYGRSEYLMGHFMIDSKAYKLGIIDPHNPMSFTYSSYSIMGAKIAILSNELMVKDSLEERDILKLDEFLNLGGTYYRFDSIASDGKQMVLIREDDFESQVGTQIGMLAPDINGITVRKDTVANLLAENKPKIIGNSCGCGGDTKSISAYYEILEEYGQDAYVLRFDASLDDDLLRGEITEGTHFDMEDPYNIPMYDSYRGTYCSRTCYVIGPNNRILDKFKITDWRENLPRVLL